MMKCTNWTPDSLLPTCVFGECDSNNNNTCICFPGFRHDFVLGRYENCALPEWASIAFTVVAFVINSVSLLSGTFVFFKRAQWGSLLWRACGAAVLSSFMFLLGLICLMATDYVTEWYGALFTLLGSVLSANEAGTVLIGVLSPVAASEHLGSIYKYEMFFMWVLPGFMLVMMLLSLGLGHGLHQVATGMAFVFVAVAICASVAFPVLYVFPTKLIRALSASLNVGNAERSRTRVNKILRKVKAFRITACVCSFIAALFCYVASGIHFASGTLPFSWAIYYGFVSALGLFHLQIINFSLPASSSDEGDGVTATSSSKRSHKWMSTLVSSSTACVRGHFPSTSSSEVGKAGSGSVVPIAPLAVVAIVDNSRFEQTSPMVSEHNDDSGV